MSSVKPKSPISYQSLILLKLKTLQLTTASPISYMPEFQADMKLNENDVEYLINCVERDVILIEE